MLNFRRLFLFLIISTIIISSCHSKTELQKPALFTLMDSTTGINFTNIVKNSKDFNIFNYRNFYNGGGVATGDINNDGLADVFFTANMGSNKLYLNKGNFQFEDVSAKAGFIDKSQWSTGVVMVDINSDGWLDIYVCNAGYQKGVGTQNQLFINNHDLTFTEEAKQYGLDEDGYTTHAAFFDYDGDGDLDCYILNNSFIPVNTLNYANKRDLRAKDWIDYKEFLRGGGDKLLRNDGGHFTDVSEHAGIYGSLIGFGLGVTVGDVNGDNWPDIYISNDFFERDYLYINQQNGTFKEDLTNRIQHLGLASMGADMADINNDGYPDIFTTDMLPKDEFRLKTTSSFDNIDVEMLKEKSGFYRQYMQNCLQVNNQNGHFAETGFYSGVAGSDWSWGALIFDADNDGLSDIYVCNGIYHDVTDQDFIDFFANDVIQQMVLTGQKENMDEVINKMPSTPIVNKAFRNTGNLSFSDEGINWGFTQPSFSNGAAYADLDNDGDLDLIINNENEKAFVYKNNSRQQDTLNHFIGVMLKGKGQNTFAIGSSIKIFSGSKIISREVVPSRGFQSSVDYKQIIGLGSSLIDSIIITWPNRTFTKYIKPKTDSVYTIVQDDENNNSIPANILYNPLLVSESAAFDKHTEDDYIDFYYERGIPMMLSKEGPRCTTGDVNGDGLDDIYICGATGQPSQLYMQTPAGKFEKKEERIFTLFADVEDVTALFFDCDKDGDLDLITGTGGNNQQPNSPAIQNHLMLNDGKGNFNYAINALPPNADNTEAIAAGDIDSDGDIDLFIGARNITGNYGIAPQSYILLNDGRGLFTDATQKLNASIAQIGMVTSATFADVTGDKKPDLIIAGEWFSPKIFSYKNGKLEEEKTNLTEMNGWWQSLAVADFDGDGKNDIMLGNYGENFYLRPDKGNPVKLFINDFDGNGTADKVLSRTIDGKDMPVFMKRDITEQMPGLKKQNLKNHDYATKTIQDLFSKDLIAKGTVKTFNYCASVIAWNDGSGKFTIQQLPLNVQLSSVNAIHVSDINADGLPDVLMGGNRFEFLPQFCRLDASYGHVLINKGKRNFEWLPSNISGLSLSGEIRDIEELKIKKSKYFLILQNNEYPLLYSSSKK